MQQFVGILKNMVGIFGPTGYHHEVPIRRQSNLYIGMHISIANLFYATEYKLAKQSSFETVM